MYAVIICLHWACLYWLIGSCNMVCFARIAFQNVKIFSSRCSADMSRKMSPSTFKITNLCEIWMDPKSMQRYVELSEYHCCLMTYKDFLCTKPDLADSPVISLPGLLLFSFPLLLFSPSWKRHANHPHDARCVCWTRQCYRRYLQESRNNSIKTSSFVRFNHWMWQKRVRLADIW